jgi:hypothetical protein
MGEQWAFRANERGLKSQLRMKSRVANPSEQRCPACDGTCPSDHSTRAARSQNLSATVHGMRWQGTDTEGGPVRITRLDYLGFLIPTMSALERIADSGRTSRHVANVPKYEILAESRCLLLCL